jgi:DNA polymerase I-like protein with 3'-5' exonuclease and polymerase domains
MIAAIDIETESLEGKTIHCIVVRDVDSEDWWVFTPDDTSYGEGREAFLSLIPKVKVWVAHNGLDFDIPVLRRHGYHIDPRKVVDTLIISRLEDQRRAGGNGLKAWGERFGFPKGDFKGFDTLSDEMIRYCKRDVDITVKLWHRFKPMLNDPKWKRALRTEHDIQTLCNTMREGGWWFDIDKAKSLKESIERDIQAIEQEFQDIWPPVLKETHRIKHRTKKDGTPYKSVTDTKEKHALTKVEGNDLVCYDWIPFDPASPQQRIDRLWEAGWKPVERTKGHINYLKENK